MIFYSYNVDCNGDDDCAAEINVDIPRAERPAGFPQLVDDQLAGRGWVRNGQWTYCPRCIAKGKRRQGKDGLQEQRAINKQGR